MYTVTSTKVHCRPYGTGHLVVWVCMVCLLELLRQLPKSIHPFTTPCQPGIPLLPLSVMPPFQITLQLVWKRWSTEYLRRYCVNWPPSYTQSTFHNLSFIGLHRQLQRWKYRSNWQYSKDFNLLKIYGNTKISHWSSNLERFHFWAQIISNALSFPPLYQTNQKQGSSTLERLTCGRRSALPSPSPASPLQVFANNWKSWRKNGHFGFQKPFGESSEEKSLTLPWNYNSSSGYRPFGSTQSSSTASTSTATTASGQNHFDKWTLCHLYLPLLCIHVNVQCNISGNSPLMVSKCQMYLESNEYRYSILNAQYSILKTQYSCSCLSWFRICCWFQTNIQYNLCKWIC